MPALIFFVLIFVYPIIRTLIMSFYRVESVTAKMSEWSFVGFENFSKLFNTQLFQIAMWNLFRIWLIGGIIVMSLALLFAIFLNSGIRFKKFYRAVIYMPNVISAVALATMWLQYVYNPRFGLFTRFFSALGLKNLASVAWTGPNHLFSALLIAYCFGMIGYHMLIFSGGIEKIPSELFEASTIDGANRIKQFRYITLPLLGGVFKTNLTMWSITSVSFFVWSQLFSTVTANTQTITPMVYMYLQVFGAGNAVTERNAGLGAAVGVLLALAVVIVFIATNVLVKDDELEF